MYLIVRYKTVFPDLTSQQQRHGVEIVLAMARALELRAFTVFLNIEPDEMVRHMSPCALMSSSGARFAHLITSRSDFERYATPNMVKSMPPGVYPFFAFSMWIDISIATKTVSFVIAPPPMDESEPLYGSNVFYVNTEEDVSASINSLLEKVLAPTLCAVERIERLATQVTQLAAQTLATSQSSSAHKLDEMLRNFFIVDNTCAMHCNGWLPYTDAEKKRITEELTLMFSRDIALAATATTQWGTQQAAAAPSEEEIDRSLSEALDYSLKEAETLERVRRAQEADAEEAARVAAAAAAAAAVEAERVAAAAVVEAELRARIGDELMAEEQEEKARKEAKKEAGGKSKKKKKKKGGENAGPSQEPEAPAEALAAVPEEEEALAAALEESARLEETRRTAEEQTLVPEVDEAEDVDEAQDAPSGELPPATVSLADASFDTGRSAVPESTIGGETTCIVCFTRPKSHLAFPCGHQCACGTCAKRMQQCPYCRTPVTQWLEVRVV